MKEEGRQKKEDRRTNKDASLHEEEHDHDHEEDENEIQDDHHEHHEAKDEAPQLAEVDDDVDELIQKTVRRDPCRTWRISVHAYARYVDCKANLVGTQ